MTQGNFLKAVPANALLKMSSTFAKKEEQEKKNTILKLTLDFQLIHPLSGPFSPLSFGNVSGLPSQRPISRQPT